MGSCRCQCVLAMKSIPGLFLSVVLTWQVAVKHTDGVIFAQDPTSNTVGSALKLIA